MVKSVLVFVNQEPKVSVFATLATAMVMFTFALLVESTEI